MPTSSAPLQSGAKNPSRVTRGRLGAVARWGPEPRVVRLDELGPAQRRLVLALIDAAKREAARDPDPTTEGNPA
jgi:hypothetical protein